MKEFLHHLLIPRESNNHRSKLLHHQSLLLVIIFLVVGSIFVRVFKHSYSSVLGTATNISVEELLSLTNKEREKAGLNDLVLNHELSKAAEFKASDMFAKNYWAHNAPDGKTPWYFFKESGYQYVYAGENLARGFSTTQDVIAAWMASPSHKENLISPNYKEIGFAVEDGKLLGENTTLVVQMFGNKTLVTQSETKKPLTQSVPQVQVAGKQLVPTTQIVRFPLIDSYAFSRNLSLLIVGMFLSVLLIDMVVVTRKKIIRFVGHNVDHLLFLGAIGALILLFTRGVIL